MTSKWLMTTMVIVVVPYLGSQSNYLVGANHPDLVAVLCCGPFEEKKVVQNKIMKHENCVLRLFQSKTQKKGSCKGFGKGIFFTKTNGDSSFQV